MRGEMPWTCFGDIFQSNGADYVYSAQAKQNRTANIANRRHIFLVWKIFHQKAEPYTEEIYSERCVPAGRDT
jgi:hypothetical protein